MNVVETVRIGGPELPRDVPGAAVLRKVAWRLLPFLCLLYVFNIIDRANVGFTRRAMQRELGMDDAVYSFGFGIFYLGYLVFEVPANLLLRRIGARRWIARIMISWGVVSCATMAVTGTWSFYAMRILLGVAEAGFFPGIILYLTYWFPAREQARAMALFMTAIAFAGVLSNPLSGAIMQFLEGVGGLQGWQWVFVIEGLPSVLLGVVVLFCLPDGPAQAGWLTPGERVWLVERLEAEDQSRRQRHGADLRRALIDPRVWLLISIYSTVAVTSNAAGANFPKLIGEMFGDEPAAAASVAGLAGSPAGPGPLVAVSARVSARTENNLVIGLLAALPHVCAMLAMALLGIHSDRTGERRGHVAFAAWMAAAGWLLAWFAPWPWLTLVGFCVAQAGMMSMLPTFWAIPTAFLSGAAAAGGIALINSVANIGGWFGPSIFDRFGMGAMAVILCAGGILALRVRTEARSDVAAIGEPMSVGPGASPGSEK